MTNKRRLIFGARAAQGALIGAVCLAAPVAHAGNCSDLTHVVYVAGSTAQEVFIGALAGALQQLSTPIHVVYQGQGSCTGVGYMSTSPTNITGTGVTFTNAGADDGVGCALDVAGVPVDLGLSDVYPASCPAATPPTLGSDVKDFFGPIQSMNFVVPIGTGGSDQTSISYEAAHIIFGVGPTTQIAPWTDPTVYEVRKSSSGTMIMTGAAIGVPGTQWWGNATAGSGAVITALAADISTKNQGENAIGILVSGDIDKNRATLRPLAYQHKGQSCGYNPDSDPTKFDKQNVRDGHYFIWGPMHLMAHTTAGVPTNADVATLVSTLAAKSAPPAGLDLISVEAKNGVVPDCAMRVTRDTEGGDLMSYMPPEGSCTCTFLVDATGAKPANCTVCATSADCKNVATPDGTVASGSCNNIVNGSGYCEVK